MTPTDDTRTASDLFWALVENPFPLPSAAADGVTVVEA